MQMSANFKYYLLYSALYGLILLVGEGMYRYLHIKPERSRNFSHLAAGLVSLPYPWLFSSHWWVLLIAVQSSLVLYITRQQGFIPSHHQSAGKGAGSILFFASLYISFMASDFSGDQSFFVIPILVLTISDVSASFFGQRYGRRPFPWLVRFGMVNKTRTGSLAFFLSAMPIVFVAYCCFLHAGLFHATIISLVISLAASVSEALSPNKIDNITIPSIILIIIWLTSYI